MLFVVDYFFKIVYIFCVFCVFCGYGSRVLFELQSNSYKLKSIWKHLKLIMVKNLLYWFLICVIVVILFVLKITSIWVYVAIVVASLIVLLFVFDFFKYVGKIKYTKRMIRIFVTYIILCCMFIFFVVNFFAFNILSIMFSFNLIIAYVFVFLTLVIP